MNVMWLCVTILLEFSSMVTEFYSIVIFVYPEFWFAGSNVL